MAGNKKTRYLALIIFLVIIPLIQLFHYNYRDLPLGISTKSEVYQGKVDFLYDLSYQDLTNSKRIVDQEIIDNMESLINEAEDFLILDIFLFNDDYKIEGTPPYPKISKQISQALIKRKLEKPDLNIIVLTDPINSMYESFQPVMFEDLKEAGVEVVLTDLSKVRDSNPLYSGLYRSYFKWIPYSQRGILPNIFDPKKPRASLRSYLDLLNFKANHRKVVISEKEAIIGSANIHDASGFHSNIGVKVQGPIIQEILKSELAVLDMSGYNTDDFNNIKFDFNNINIDENLDIRLVTERKIKDEILEEIQSCQAGDHIKLASFYLADLDIIKALERAANRDVKINLILDLNKDAFGQKKIGIPNKPVAAKLVKKKNIQVRWYETQGEQFHAKFIIFEKQNQVSVIAGSANYTRRNLDDLNLESNLIVYGTKEQIPIQEILTHYDRLWNNKDGIFTSEYEKYQEDKIWKDIIYKIQETTGLSTF